MPLTIAEGTTANLDFTLTADGAAVNLTGATVTLVLKDKSGTEITTTGNVSVVTAASGKVRYAPDAADLGASATPHRARFKVADSGGLIAYYPSGKADPWTITPV
jgi:hypothetical protein